MMLYKIMYLGAVCSQTSGSELQYHKFQNTLSYTESSMQFLKKKKSFIPYTAAAAKSLQSCPTLCDPRDGSPPGSPVPGILQARTLEWVAISFSIH